MRKSRNSKDEKRVNSACEAILKIIKPGDVINQSGDFYWWQFWLAIGSLAIQYYQKKLFGKEANWKDDHTMLYFSEDNTFSVEPPQATMKPLWKYCLSNLSIYRLHLTEITPKHIECMKSIALRIVDTDYDIGQLMDIAINGILGYDHQRRLKIFDFGRKKKVCSVGVRVIFEHLYQAEIKRVNSKIGKWLFHDLNPEKWPVQKVEEYRGTDVEATSPAHFANSDYFCGEFTLVARFNGGKQVSP